MLTARAATTAMVTSETSDSLAKRIFIRRDRGMASAGAKLVPLAKEV